MEEVVYIKYENRYLHFKTNIGREYQIVGRIKDISKYKLAEKMILINRSELVNPQYIVRCDKRMITLLNQEQELEVSKYQWSNVREKYRELYMQIIKK